MSDVQETDKYRKFKHFRWWNVLDDMCSSNNLLIHGQVSSKLVLVLDRARFSHRFFFAVYLDDLPSHATERVTFLSRDAL